MGLFGDLVRELRWERGWSQDQLARETGLSKGRINEIDSLDKPTVHPSTFAKLAAAFGMEVRELRKLLEERGKVVAVRIELVRDRYERLVTLAESKGLPVEVHAAAVLTKALGKTPTAKLKAPSIGERGYGGSSTNRGRPRKDAPASNGTPPGESRGPDRHGPDPRRSK